MSDKIMVETFPRDRTEALTLLYLQKQSFSNSSPAELVETYFDTEEKIRSAFSAHFDKIREKRDSLRL